MIPPHEHHRRSIRLKGYDYTQPGAYFVTLVAWRRECLFGEVVDGVMQLNPIGKIVQTEWQQITRHFPHTHLDAFMVMPNHVHGILTIDPPAVGATHPVPDMDRAGIEPSPDQGRAGMDGSPPSTPPAFDRNDGATRPVPDMDRDGMDRGPDQARDRMDGSPLHIARPDGPPVGSLGAMIGQFKSRATKRIWGLPGIRRRSIWQRNYYEHIIRNETEFKLIWDYIHNNPHAWDKDQLRPKVYKRSDADPFNQDTP